MRAPRNWSLWAYSAAIEAVSRTRAAGVTPARDLLIAATAHANGLDLYTRNGDDVFGLPSSSTS